MLSLDHIAISCRNLDEGRAHVEAALGAPLQTGGKHARFGSHNLLMGLEDGVYLEVIAIDPEAPAPDGQRWFGLDDFDGPPRLTNWICASDHMAAALALAPPGIGPAMELTRGDLRWQMAAAPGGSLPYDQCFPALIDWGASAHPSTRLAPTGIRLERLEITHPQAGALGAALAPLINDPRIALSQGAGPSMRAHFATPRGPGVLT